jgi:salicylate hydroxylase
MKIAIVGGGIGWLFAANALVPAGSRRRSTSSRRSCDEIGAGVLLTPTTSGSWSGWRWVAPSRSAACGTARLHDHRHDGTVVGPTAMSSS